MSAHPDQTSLNGKGQHKDTNFVKEFSGHAAALVETITPLNPSGPSLSHRADAVDYRAWLEAARVRPTDEIEEAPACLMIEQDGKQYVIGSLGNLSTISGRAKAKKTFAVSLAIAAAVASLLILNRIRGSLPVSQQTVLLFDTEQSRHHVLRVIKRICRLSGIDDPPNLIVYSLRPYAPQDRLKVIDFALNNTPGIGLVVIDGVRDLAVDPVLDSEQASQIMTHLLQWTDRLNIHIMSVLHQNKNDTNLRGHLGTELANKSETVISITRDSHDKEVSVVSPEYCRDREFEAFRFSVDDTGLPFLVDSTTGPLIDSTSGYLIRTKAIKPTIDTMTPDVVVSIINRAFSIDPELRYTQLLINLIEAAEYVGITLAKSRAEQFIHRTVLQGQIEKFTPPKSPYPSYRIPVDQTGEPSP